MHSGNQVAPTRSSIHGKVGAIGKVAGIIVTAVAEIHNESYIRIDSVTQNESAANPDIEIQCAAVYRADKG